MILEITFNPFKIERNEALQSSPTDKYLSDNHCHVQTAVNYSIDNQKDLINLIIFSGDDFEILSNEGALYSFCYAYSEEDLGIAQTIFQQIGGLRFAKMTGAKEFSVMTHGLRFQLPPITFNRNGITSVVIHLDFDDTYTLFFYKRIDSDTPFRKVKNVYCDQLEDVFERETGLLTSLTRQRVLKLEILK
jgi:hypothetical protein